jgi:hypothetical protein
MDYNEITHHMINNYGFTPKETLRYLVKATQYGVVSFFNVSIVYHPYPGVYTIHRNAGRIAA